MDKSEIQYLWDMCLINGWKYNNSMLKVCNEFLRVTKPEMQFRKDDVQTKESVQVVKDYITSLELKRCRDADTAGNIVFQATYGPVRRFIASRCPLMANTLRTGTVDPLDILEHIANYKWRRVSNKGRAAQRHRIIRHKRERGDDQLFVEAKNLGKKHDWKTVK